MLIKPLTIADVQTTDLIYYDPDFNKICLDFCEKRDIDCIPSLTDPNKYYRKTGNGFLENEISDEMIVNSHTEIFDPILLHSFCNHSVQFVKSNNYLRGVVHFCDYNKPIVHTYLFNIISAYERSLRKLLCLSRLTNEDMLKHLREKKKREPSGEIEKLPAFERFYLFDLIQFINESGVIAVSEESNQVRKAVMHAHELVYLEDPYREDYIYTLESFKVFFNRVRVLLADSKRVNNRIVLYELEESEKKLDANKENDKQ
jgi:hypothetical protein